jgi:hypothetical protein
MMGTDFQLLGSPHLATLVLIVAVALVLPLAARFLQPAARPVGIAIAGLLLTQKGVQRARAVMREGPSVALLPLHL